MRVIIFNLIIYMLAGILDLKWVKCASWQVVVDFSTKNYTKKLS